MRCVAPSMLRNNSIIVCPLHEINWSRAAQMKVARQWLAGGRYKRRKIRQVFIQHEQRGITNFQQSVLLHGEAHTVENPEPSLVVCQWVGAAISEQSAVECFAECASELPPR